MNKMTEIDKKRLIWRSRRGLLELDVLLQKFLEEDFVVLSDVELFIYEQILELPDAEFLDIINKVREVEDKKWLPVIERIRSKALLHT